MMGLTLDVFMAWKAEEMTMNTSLPRIAKSRDLVADFKKGIKRDPSLFPSLKHIDNWPTFKRETMAQAFAQDVVNVFNPKYKPRGSEEKDLFTLQLYYIYAIFCSKLKTDFRRKLVRDYESSQNAQAIWKELSNDAEKSKRDPSLFPSLKHIDNWPTFKHETMAQAFAQDVVNVFNPKYKPRGSEEKDLFTLQLYYIYVIFCSNLKTDFGRKLVRDYESSQNAQAIWRELSNDAERSTVAQLNATDLLQYTHMAQVENWKGTTLSFILHYQEQIRLYDQLQPPNEQTSDHPKMIYLQNAVYTIEELRSVQTTGSQLALANGTVPMYKDYEALLKSAASTYDRAHAPAKRQPTRSAERTDIWDANITESFHEAYEFGFDIDTPTDIVQAHMRDQSGVIPKETFGRLSPESRKAWSQLSDDVRVDILQALQANGSQHSQESTRTPSLHDKPRYN
jgi:hypothetical protein